MPLFVDWQLHVKILATKPPFLVICVVNFLAIALTHYCSDENLDTIFSIVIMLVWSGYMWIMWIFPSGELDFYIWRTQLHSLLLLNHFIVCSHFKVKAIVFGLNLYMNTMESVLHIVVLLTCSVHLRPGTACLARTLLTAAYCSCLQSISTCIVTSCHRQHEQAAALWLHGCSFEVNIQSKAVQDYCRHDFAGPMTKTLMLGWMSRILL